MSLGQEARSKGRVVEEGKVGGMAEEVTTSRLLKKECIAFVLDTLSLLSTKSTKFHLSNPCNNRQVSSKGSHLAFAIIILQIYSDVSIFGLHVQDMLDTHGKLSNTTEFVS